MPNPHVFKNMKSEYYEIESGSGNVHIHINYDETGVKQVFVHVPPVGTEIAGLASCLSVFVSKYLLEGGSIENAIKHLNAVRSDRPTLGDNPIWSIPHAISIALKIHGEKIK